MSEQPTSPQTLAKIREQTIDALCQHFAEDRLSMSELERRLDVATVARTRDELAALLNGLTPGENVPVPVSPAEKRASGRTAADRVGGVGKVTRRGNAAEEGTRAPARRKRTAITEDDRAAAADSVVVAIMSGSRKVGRWRPPIHTHAVAFWGGVVLDFRDAVLPDGRFEVSAIAVMGGVEIIVPPDLPVETNGLAFMGGFDQVAETVHADDDGAGPRLVVSGFALMGGVSVRLRPSDESGPAELRRRRGTRHLSDEERRLALEERRLERHARRLDRQAQRLEDRRRDLEGE